MSEQSSLCRLARAKKERANEILLSLAKDNEVSIDSLAPVSEGEIVEQMQIEAPSIEIGENCFHDAKIKISKVNVLREVYFKLLKVFKIVYYKEIPLRETICGVTVIIIFRVVVFR
jgi:hypothetical protein